MSTEKMKRNAKNMLMELNIETLIDLYEENDNTSTPNNWRIKSTVRELLLDVLEDKNEKAFWKWVDESEEKSPRKFYIEGGN
jgi:hypothetical protein